MGAAHALVWVLIVVASIQFAPGPTAAALDPVIDPATVLVTGTLMCSATYIAPATLLTAKHCVEPRIGAPVSLSQPGTRWSCTGRIRLLGAGDWATVDGCLGRAMHPVSVWSVPTTGHPVRTVGYPFALAGRSQAELAGRTLGGASGDVYLDMPVISGYSGAALLDGDDPTAPVVAVVSWRLATAWNGIRSGAVLVTDVVASAAAAAAKPAPHRQLLPVLRYGSSQ